MAIRILSHTEAKWVVDAFTDESKRQDRIILMERWPELHEALEALATGHVPVRSSKAD